eukprot:778736-Prorocentrum_minimum.AAC.4
MFLRQFWLPGFNFLSKDIGDLVNRCSRGFRVSAQTTAVWSSDSHECGPAQELMRAKLDEDDFMEAIRDYVEANNILQEMQDLKCEQELRAKLVRPSSYP